MVKKKKKVTIYGDPNYHCPKCGRKGLEFDGFDASAMCEHLKCPNPRCSYTCAGRYDIEEYETTI